MARPIIFYYFSQVFMRFKALAIATECLQGRCGNIMGLNTCQRDLIVLDMIRCILRTVMGWNRELHRRISTC
jgi:hypothetical protein